MNTKRCPRCKLVKKITDFSVANKRKDKCAVYCKVCFSLLAKKKYAQTLESKKCIKCGKIFLGYKNKKECRNRCGFQPKPISGYKKCLWCNKEFPYRESLNVRGYKEIHSVKSKYCSQKCSLILKNKSLEHRLKIRKINKGRKFSEEHKKKLSEAKRGKHNPKISGNKSPFWKGGISKLNKRIRMLLENKNWREKVFKRDDYTCQFCGLKGNKLHADHIKPFSLILKENKIKSIKDAIKCKELWDTNNGRTLCEPCHKKTETWGSKKRQR